MSVLPGHVRALYDEEKGQTCEENDCTNLVELAVAGEVDSFGVEWHCMCKPCHEKEKALPPSEDECDLCLTTAILKPWRDWEEGNNGPVYYICQHCREQKAAYLKECMGDDDPMEDFYVEEDMDEQSEVYDDLDDDHLE